MASLIPNERMATRDSVQRPVAVHMPPGSPLSAGKSKGRAPAAGAALVGRGRPDAQAQLEEEARSRLAGGLATRRVAHVSAVVASSAALAKWALDMRNSDDPAANRLAAHRDRTPTLWPMDIAPPGAAAIATKIAERLPTVFLNEPTSEHAPPLTDTRLAGADTTILAPPTKHEAEAIRGGLHPLNAAAGSLGGVDLVFHAFFQVLIGAFGPQLDRPVGASLVVAWQLAYQELLKSLGPSVFAEDVTRSLVWGIGLPQLAELTKTQSRLDKWRLANRGCDTSSPRASASLPSSEAEVRAELIAFSATASLAATWQPHGIGGVEPKGSQADAASRGGCDNDEPRDPSAAAAAPRPPPPLPPGQTSSPRGRAAERTFPAVSETPLRTATECDAPPTQPRPTRKPSWEELLAPTGRSIEADAAISHRAVHVLLFLKRLLGITFSLDVTEAAADGGVNDVLSGKWAAEASAEGQAGLRPMTLRRLRRLAMASFAQGLGLATDLLPAVTALRNVLSTLAAHCFDFQEKNVHMDPEGLGTSKHKQDPPSLSLPGEFSGTYSPMRVAVAAVDEWAAFVRRSLALVCRNAVIAVPRTGSPTPTNLRRGRSWRDRTVSAVESSMARGGSGSHLTESPRLPSSEKSSTPVATGDVSDCDAGRTLTPSAAPPLAMGDMSDGLAKRIYATATELFLPTGHRRWHRLCTSGADEAFADSVVHTLLYRPPQYVLTWLKDCVEVESIRAGDTPSSDPTTVDTPTGIVEVVLPVVARESSSGVDPVPSPPATPSGRPSSPAQRGTDKVAGYRMLLQGVKAVRKALTYAVGSNDTGESALVALCTPSRPQLGDVEEGAKLNEALIDAVTAWRPVLVPAVAPVTVWGVIGSWLTRDLVTKGLDSLATALIIAWQYRVLPRLVQLTYDVFDLRSNVAFAVSPSRMLTRAAASWSLAMQRTALQKQHSAFAVAVAQSVVSLVGSGQRAARTRRSIESSIDDCSSDDVTSESSDSDNASTAASPTASPTPTKKADIASVTGFPKLDIRGTVGVAAAVSRLVNKLRRAADSCANRAVSSNVCASWLLAASAAESLGALSPTVSGLPDDGSPQQPLSALCLQLASSIVREAVLRIAQGHYTVVTRVTKRSLSQAFELLRSEEIVGAVSARLPDPIEGQYIYKQTLRNASDALDELVTTRGSDRRTAAGRAMFPGAVVSDNTVKRLTGHSFPGEERRSSARTAPDASREAAEDSVASGIPLAMSISALSAGDDDEVFAGRLGHSSAAEAMLSVGFAATSSLAPPHDVRSCESIWPVGLAAAAFFEELQRNPSAPALYVAAFETASVVLLASLRVLLAATRADSRLDTDNTQAELYVVQAVPIPALADALCARAVDMGISDSPDKAEQIVTAAFAAALLDEVCDALQPVRGGTSPVAVSPFGSITTFPERVRPLLVDSVPRLLFLSLAFQVPVFAALDLVCDAFERTIPLALGAATWTQGKTSPREPSERRRTVTPSDTDRIAAVASLLRSGSTAASASRIVVRHLRRSLSAVLAKWGWPDFSRLWLGVDSHRHRRVSAAPSISGEGSPESPLISLPGSDAASDDAWALLTEGPRAPVVPEVVATGGAASLPLVSVLNDRRFVGVVSTHPRAPLRHVLALSSVTEARTVMWDWDTCPRPSARSRPSPFASASTLTPLQSLSLAAPRGIAVPDDDDAISAASSAPSATFTAVGGDLRSQRQAAFEAYACHRAVNLARHLQPRSKAACDGVLLGVDYRGLQRSLPASNCHEEEALIDVATRVVHRYIDVLGAIDSRLAAVIAETHPSRLHNVPIVKTFCRQVVRGTVTELQTQLPRLWAAASGGNRPQKSKGRRVVSGSDDDEPGGSHHAARRGSSDDDNVVTLVKESAKAVDEIIMELLVGLEGNDRLRHCFAPGDMPDDAYETDDETSETSLRVLLALALVSECMCIATPVFLRRRCSDDTSELMSRPSIVVEGWAVFSTVLIGQYRQSRDVRPAAALPPAYQNASSREASAKPRRARLPGTPLPEGALRAASPLEDTLVARLLNVHLDDPELVPLQPRMRRLDPVSTDDADEESWYALSDAWRTRLRGDSTQKSTFTLSVERSCRTMLETARDGDVKQCRAHEHIGMFLQALDLVMDEIDVARRRQHRQLFERTALPVEGPQRVLVPQDLFVPACRRFRDVSPKVTAKGCIVLAFCAFSVTKNMTATDEPTQHKWKALFTLFGRCCADVVAPTRAARVPPNHTPPADVGIASNIWIRLVANGGHHHFEESAYGIDEVVITLDDSVPSLLRSVSKRFTESFTAKHGDVAHELAKRRPGKVPHTLTSYALVSAIGSILTRSFHDWLLAPSLPRRAPEALATCVHHGNTAMLELTSSAFKLSQAPEELYVVFGESLFSVVDAAFLSLHSGSAAADSVAKYAALTNQVFRAVWTVNARGWRTV